MLPLRRSLLTGAQKLMIATTSPPNTTADSGARTSIPAPAAARPAGGSPALAPRVTKPLVSLRRHRRLAVLVFGAVFLLGLPVAWVKGKVAYYTEGAVYVSPRFVSNLHEDQELSFQSNTQYRQFVQQQVATVTRFEILANVVARTDSGSAVWPASLTAEQAARWLQRHLLVKQVPETYLIRIGLESGSPKDLAQTVNGVIDAYMEQNQLESVYASDERTGKLQSERDRLLQDLEAQSLRQTTLAQALGVTSFNVSVLNPYDQLLVDSRKELNDTRQDRIRADARLAALSEDARPEAPAAADAEAMARVLADDGFISLVANLNSRRSVLLAKRSSLAEDHPGRGTVTRELAAIETELDSTAARLATRYRGHMLERLKTESFEARRIERDLTVEVEELASQASSFAAMYQDARALESDIQRLRNQVGSIEDRVDFLQIESHAPGFVRAETRARTPEEPSSGGRRKFVLLFTVLGLVLAVAVPVLVDHMDPRIHTPLDLDRTLGFGALGWLLERTDAETRDFGRDQLRRMAAVLERDCRDKNTRNLLVTSVKPGGGATSVAVDLAAEMASLGLRAIVVETNARSERPQVSVDPEAWREFDVEMSGQTNIDHVLRLGGESTQRRVRLIEERPNLARVLAGRFTAEQGVIAGRNGHPDRLPLGPIDGHTLPDIHRMRQVLIDLEAQYDLVIIDAAPLLLSADTELLVRLTGATLLVVQAGGVSRGEVRRALRLLQTIGPEVVGVMLNRVPIYQGGGYFTGLLQEFQTGRKKEQTRWVSPWLWN